jgi:hypothetical protein
MWREQNNQMDYILIMASPPITIPSFPNSTAAVKRSAATRSSNAFFSASVVYSEEWTV